MGIRKKRRNPGFQTPDSQLDNPPTKEEAAPPPKRHKRAKPTAEENDLPKGFKRILRYQEIKSKQAEGRAAANAARVESKRSGKGQNKGPAPIDLTAHMKQKEGESFNAYTSRLREVTKQAVKQAEHTPVASEVNKAISERTKKNRETRKAKLSHKARVDEEEAASKTFAVDLVQFNEVANAPPTISVRPKARGNAAILEAALKAKKERELAGKGGRDKSAAAKKEAPSALDAQLDSIKKQNREKSRNLSGVAKATRDAERERTIAGYRALKAQRLAAAEEASKK